MCVCVYTCCIVYVCISENHRAYLRKASINQLMDMILIDPKISAGVFKSIQAQVCAVD